MISFLWETCLIAPSFQAPWIFRDPLEVPREFIKEMKKRVKSAIDNLWPYLNAEGLFIAESHLGNNGFPDLILLVFEDMLKLTPYVMNTSLPAPRDFERARKVPGNPGDFFVEHWKGSNDSAVIAYKNGGGKER